MKPEKHTSESDKCPLCGNTMWKLKQQNVEGYKGKIDFADACPRCSKRAKIDSNGIPDLYINLDLTKMNWAYYKDSTQAEKIKRLGTSYLREYNGKANMGLYFYSQTPGSGKTMFACCLAQSISYKYDLTVQFSTVREYLTLLKSTFKDNSLLYDPIHKYKNCDLLILDDIGVEKRSDWLDEVLFDLIDYRIRNQ